MKIYAFINGKGGVGKTTLSVAIAMCLAQLGRRVLLGDFDNQGNATGSFVELKSVIGKPNIFDVFNGTRIEPISVMEGLDLLPATNDLLQLDKSVNTEELFFLGDNLRKFYGDYDDIILDTPGTLGTRVTMALTAADGVAFPTVLDDFSFQALTQLVRVMAPVHRGLNPNMHFIGVVGNLVDGISKETGEPMLKSEKEAYHNLLEMLQALEMSDKFLGLVGKLESIKQVRNGHWTTDKNAQQQLTSLAKKLIGSLNQG